MKSSKPHRRSRWRRDQLVGLLVIVGGGMLVLIVALFGIAA